jgi:hypothetical protein
MDIASDDRDDAAPAAEDLLVSFNGRRVIRRAVDGEFVIGREVPPSHIQIAHPAISRLHIRLVPGARWALIDYDSRNGVYLHGRRIEYETPITDCMTVHLGAPGGIPVAFHYIAIEQDTPTATVDEADPDIVRIGRAVIERYLELGLSPRELQQDNATDPLQFARFTHGYAWPQPAACAALESALAWPVGTLEAIRQGQPQGEITDGHHSEGAVGTVAATAGRPGECTGHRGRRRLRGRRLARHHRPHLPPTPQFSTYAAS